MQRIGRYAVATIKALEGQDIVSNGNCLSTIVDDQTLWLPIQEGLSSSGLLLCKRQRPKEAELVFAAALSQSGSFTPLPTRLRC